jgi:uncharacterized protein
MKRLEAFYRKVTGSLSRSAFRHPYTWLIIIILLSLPAFQGIKSIKLDTNLIRLLPGHSPAAVNTRQLESVVSDGGYFTFMLEGGSTDNLKNLVAATKDAAERIREIPGIEAVDYQWPVEFIKKFRYLLVPTDYLEKILDKIVGMKSKLSPSGNNLLEEEDEVETFGQREDRQDMEITFMQLANFYRYHKSADGKIMGILVRPAKGVTHLGKTRKLYKQLQYIAQSIGKEYSIWTGVGGSHRNKLDEYGLIMSDLNVSGWVSGALILLVLLMGFRSTRIVAVVIFPLLLGLLWGFSLVPVTVGGLNIITAFLLLILFGMGVDFSIHLVQRFQTEYREHTAEEALARTYVTTGLSVVISALTTALSLSILGVSDFKGFSEFGVISALVLTTTLLAMFLALPPVVAIGVRLGFFKGRAETAADPTQASSSMAAPEHRFKSTNRTPRRWLWTSLSILALLGTIAAVTGLKFDYNFRNLQFDRQNIPGSQEVRERQLKVYSRSLSPGAIYLIPTTGPETNDESKFEVLDRMRSVISDARRKEGSLIGRVRSLRDFAPDAEDFDLRLELLEEMKEESMGRWVEKIKEEDWKRWVKELRDWTPPTRKPLSAELPVTFKRPLVARDGSGRLLLTLHPNADRKDGRNAMAFTEELYKLKEDSKIPEGVRGPVGETAVFAEILWVVTSEGPWLIALTLLGVFLLVRLGTTSLKDTLLVLLPLAAGVAMCFGLMTVLGLKLNFFNIVVVGALLGMGVDGGVHYVRHWRETGGDTAATQRELFQPLTIATGTTMLGYSGMVFASHPGIRSIGIFACLGLTLVWVATLYLLPGLLDFLKEKPKELSKNKQVAPTELEAIQ